jgi:hypothetical protein
MADRALLAVQLLLLACQVTVHWYKVAGEYHTKSKVPDLTPRSSQKQQQQQQQQQQEQQPIAADTPVYLRLPHHHELLLESYRCKDADVAAILGRKHEGLPHNT